MALILSIETATKVCSVAIMRKENTLTTQSLFIGKSHASMLAILIQDSIKQAGIVLGELDAIAVSDGPGSYTGLRIGLSTAKGLCFALGIPLITVDTLAAMAAGMQPYNAFEAWLCPMIDARRMEVYTALYDPNGVVRQPVQAKVIDQTAFAKELVEHDILFFGDGAAKCQQEIQSPMARFIPLITTSAQHVGQLAYRKFQNGQFADLAYHQPGYLKDFVATKPKHS